MGLDINVHLCNIFSHFLDSSLKSEQHELITTMIKFTIQQFTNATQVTINQKREGQSEEREGREGGRERERTEMN